MTNKKALEGFEKLLKDIEPDNHLFVGTINPEFVEAAIEALKKQIPKKPKYRTEDRFVKNHFNEYSYCPVCKKEVVAGDMFCVMCGQAIDWTEGEE